MKKSFVFDVLFILLMVGVVACEEEIESISLSNSSVQEWSEASVTFFAELANPKKDSPDRFEYGLQTRDSWNTMNETKASHQVVVFESEEFENAGLIFSEEERQEQLRLQIFGVELEKAAAQKGELKLNNRDLKDLNFKLDFLKEKVKMMVNDPDLIRVVIKENSRPKELKVNSFS